MKSNKVKPTKKQRLAVKYLAEDGGSQKDALLKAGYSEITALTPTKVTETKGFKQLMDEVLPDDFLTQKHKELLNTPIKKTIRRIGEETITEESLDVQAIGKGLDMAYKIKGHYAPVKSEVSGSIDISEEKQTKSNDAILAYLTGNSK